MAFGFTYTLPTITGTHTDFRVVLKTADFPAASIDGSGDAFTTGGGEIIAYTSSAKTTQLPIEIVTFVSSASVPDAEVWVKIGSAVTGGTIFLEKDDTQSSQPAVTATYGRDAVWDECAFNLHLEDDSTDSAGNVTMSNVGATPTYNVDAALGDGITVDGGGLTSSDTAAFSIASGYRYGFWGNLNATQTNWATLFRQGNNLTFQRLSSGTNMRIRHGGSQGDVTSAFGNLLGLGLSKYDITWDGTTSRIYIDGSEDTSNGFTETPSVGGDWTLFYESGTVYLDATQIDEVVFDNQNRSADWLATEFANQNASSAWGTVGSWAEPGGASAVLGRHPIDGGMNPVQGGMQ